MLRIGLLTDEAELRLFDAELIQKIQAAKIAEIILVIQQDLPKKSFVELVRHALERGSLASRTPFFWTRLARFHASATNHAR
jgi:hypothetical protein